MSRTYGVLRGRRGERTVCGNESVTAVLSTWKGSVHISVNDDESCVINVMNLDVKINGMKMYRNHDEVSEQNKALRECRLDSFATLQPKRLKEIRSFIDAELLKRKGEKFVVEVKR